MSVKEEVLAANEAYAADFGAKGELALPPARRFAILTCMDARLDPAKYAGLSEGDAHVIRNAGGRASDDAIRSLVISYKLLGTGEWFVIHHTRLRHGVLHRRRDARPAGQLASRPPRSGPRASTTSAAGPGSPEGEYIDWLTIADQRTERRRRRRANPQPSARARPHPDLRLRLRRRDRPPPRGARSD